MFKFNIIQDKILLSIMTLKILTFLFLVTITCSLRFTGQNSFVKTVWIYWDKNLQNAPLFVQLCYEKIKMSCEKDNWNLVLLTDRNLPQYIPNYKTQFLAIKKKAQHPEWKAVYADLIRYTVLDEHGGVWVDISTILIHSMSWLQNLELFPYLLANSNIDKGQQPDVVYPYLSYYLSQDEKRDSDGNIENWLPGYENWFIVSKKKAPVMTAWRRNFERHYQSPYRYMEKEQTQKGYFLKFLSKTEYLNSDKTIAEIVQDKQKQIDKNLTIFSKRKNANKQLKILGLHGQYGPLANNLAFIVDKSEVLTHTLQEIEENHYITIHCFVKSTSGDRPFYIDKINKLQELGKAYKNISRDFQDFMKQQNASNYCDFLNFIVEGSVIGILIKDNKKAIENNLFPITIEQRNKWFEFCHNAKNETILSKVKKLYPDFFDPQKKIKDNIIRYLLAKSTWMVEKGWITEDSFIKIADYFFKMPRMGSFNDDTREVYYWKRLYQQKYGIFDQTKNSNQNQLTSQNFHQIDENSQPKSTVYKNLNLTQPLNEMSMLAVKDAKPLSSLGWFEYYFLLIKLNILSRQLFIHKLINVSRHMFNFFITFLTLILNTFICVKVAQLIIKYRVIPVKIYRLACWCYKNKCKVRQVDAKQYIQKNCGSYFFWFLKEILAILKKNLKQISKTIIGLIFGVFFFSSYVYILAQYELICDDGKIIYQEPKIIKMMLVQIFFRWMIFYRLDKDFSLLPGLKFRLLYEAMLPVYYFGVGSAIVTLGERRQERIVDINFFLCLVIPALMKQVEYQAKCCSLHWDQKKQSYKNLVRIIIEKMLFILTNLSTIIQLSILFSMFLLLILPSIRYLMIDQTYLPVVIYKHIVDSAKYVLILLFELYRYDISCIFTKITKKNQEKSYQVGNNLQLTSEISETQLDIQIEKPNKMQCLKKYVLNIQNFSILVLIILKNALNLYVFYKLLINPIPEKVPQYSSYIERWKVIQFSILFCINFQIQVFLNTQMLKLYSQNKTKKQSQQHSQKSQNSQESQILRILQQIKQMKQYVMKFIKPKDTDENQYERKQSNNKLISNTLIIILLVIGLICFQYVRIVSVENLLKYYQELEPHKKDKRFRYDFTAFKEYLIAYTFIAYLLMSFIMNFFKTKQNRKDQPQPQSQNHIKSSSQPDTKLSMEIIKTMDFQDKQIYQTQIQMVKKYHCNV